MILYILYLCKLRNLDTGVMGTWALDLEAIVLLLFQVYDLKEASYLS